MRTLIKLNSKIICRSPIYWAVLCFVFLFFSLFVYLVYPSSINFAATLGAVAYIEITIIILDFCMAVYFSHRQYCLENICQISRTHSVIGRLVSQIIVSSGLLIFPFVFTIVASLLESTDFLFNVEVGITVLLRWFCIILVSSSFGFLIGTLIKKYLVYLVVIPFCIIFSYLNSYLFSYIFPQNSKEFLIITNLLSVQEPFMTSVKLDYVSNLLDSFWLIKKVFILAIVGILIFLIVVITGFRKQKLIYYLLPGILLTAIIVVSCFMYVKSFPEPYNYDAKLYVTSESIPAYSIKSYIGEITLSEKMVATCSLTVGRNSTNCQDLRFRLDASFKVDQICFNNQAIPYIHEGDYITISKEYLPKNDIFTLSFVYHGRVYYISDIEGLNIFSSNRATALPSSFAFIPIIDGDNTLKNYSLEIHGENNIISNIIPEKNQDGTYQINGKSDTLCLFMGYFTSFTVENTVVFKSSNNKLTDYNKIYGNATEYPYLDPYTGETIDESFGTRPVAFLIYDLYGVLGLPVVYQDYWIMNYGFPV